MLSIETNLLYWNDFYADIWSFNRDGHSRPSYIGFLRGRAFQRYLIYLQCIKKFRDIAILKLTKLDIDIWKLTKCDL